MILALFYSHSGAIMYNATQASSSSTSVPNISYASLTKAWEEYQKALQEAPGDITDYFTNELKAARAREVNEFRNYTSFLRQHDDEPDLRMFEVHEYLLHASQLFAMLTKLATSLFNRQILAQNISSYQAVPEPTFREFHKRVELCYQDMVSLAGNVILRANVTEPGPKPSVKDIQLLTNFASRTNDLYKQPTNPATLYAFYDAIDELPTKKINWSIIAGIVLLAVGISLLVIASPLFGASLAVFNQVIWSAGPVSPIVGGVGVMVGLIGAALFAGGSRQAKPFEFFYQNTFIQHAAKVKSQGFTIREHESYQEPSYAMNQGPAPVVGIM
jgi:hypothetical protein